MQLQHSHYEVLYFLNHSCYMSNLQRYLCTKTCEWLVRPSCLTHVCSPVKSPAVLLVKGINIGSLRQQQTDHLSRKGTGKTKKFRDGKIAGGGGGGTVRVTVGYKLWVSHASVGVCLTLYNVHLNTIQNDSSTKTDAWSQFRTWAWKEVCGRILLEHLKWFEGSSVRLSPQLCVNEVLGMDKMGLLVMCWIKDLVCKISKFDRI